MSTKPQRVDPAPGYARETEKKAAGSVNAFLGMDPSKFMRQLQFGLGGDQLGAARGAQQQANPFLMSLMQGGNFGPGFGELRNPFSQLGYQNQAENVISAARPQFDRSLQDALARASAASPNVYSTPFAAEGRDISTQALQDFNLLSQQALMQGLQMQQQDQQSALNFLLGARGLAQQDQESLRNATLQQRGLGLNAANSIFGQGQALSQLGLDQQNMLMNPLTQLLLGAWNFGSPTAYQFGPSQMQNFGSLVGGLAQGAGAIGFNPFGGGGGPRQLPQPRGPGQYPGNV